MLLKGHGLIDEGRTYRYGYRQRVGSGKCSCGAMSSPTLTSDAQRKQWHAEHKASIAARQAESR